MSNRELSKLYKETVAPIGHLAESRHLVKGFNESVSLYQKKGDDYELVGDIDDEFYNDTLKKYIKLGSTNSIGTRKIIQTVLKKNNGATSDNLNTFQSYVEDGGFLIDEDTLKKGEEFILKCIENNEGIMLDSFIEEIYGDNVNVNNKYFKEAWATSPAAAVMGRAGSGELFLAFFCNGVKPQKGDLRVGSEDIELKGYNGRLYKSGKIDPAEALNELADGDFKNDEELLSGIADTVGKLAGTDMYNSEVQALISTEDIKNEVVENYIYFKRKGKFPSLSIIVKIAGVVQLLAYKEAQKFDSMIAFNDKLGGNNIWMQFINFKDLSNIEDVWNRISNLPSSIRTAVRTDGFGFSLQANVDKDSNMVRKSAQDVERDLKKQRISAGKVDTKDIKVGSLLSDV